MTVNEECLERDEWRCFKCGEVLRDSWPGYSCHHRQLKSGGGSDTLENRISLCGSGSMGCHGLVHARPRWARMAGFIVSRYDNPADVSVIHWQHGPVYLTADGGIITGTEHLARGGGDGT